jgi:hypothetical protein
MRKFFFIGLILIFTSKSFSQTSNFTIEANYPMLIDNNFYGREYNGILDLGAKYRAVEFKNLKLGAAINTGLLIDNSNSNQDLSDFRVASYLLQPKIFTELNIPTLSKLHPFVGLGYSFLISDVSGTISGLDVSDTSTRNGINVNFGIYYDLNNNIFLQIQYDFVKFRMDEKMPNDSFITNMNILKIGLGLRL